ncbi:MAG: terminase large subunit domain-containing protein, partial [Brevundimonas sp.]
MDLLSLLDRDRRAALMWRVDAHKGQTLETDDWRTWVFLGGRGAGKTRAGAEWVWETAQALGKGGRIALVAPTIRDARTVMVEGPSGLLRLPYRDGARFASSKRQVTFPGGAVGMLFSAEEPERLRGPQFHAAWGDEFCAWGQAEETLAMLRLGLRLGVGPRLV